MSFRTILDTHGKGKGLHLVSCTAECIQLKCVFRKPSESVVREKPSSIAVVDTLKPVRLAPTSIPSSKAHTYFVLPIHPLNGTQTQFKSQLSQLASLTCLFPLHLHYLEWI